MTTVEHENIPELGEQDHQILVHEDPICSIVFLQQQSIRSQVSMQHPYSDTDRSHLTDNDILKCLKHSNFCIPYLIEKIHFDANKPENHNVYISFGTAKIAFGVAQNAKDRSGQPFCDF
jgi:hypothetical protein